MTYIDLMYLHLWTVIPAFVLGTISLILKKGTSLHKAIGKIYMILMLITAIITLFMKAQVGPKLLDHFGYIHLFSFLTLWTVPGAYIAIRKGNIRSHKRKMILLYFGAIIISGVFTFFPGRYLHQVFFA